MPSNRAELLLLFTTMKATFADTPFAVDSMAPLSLSSKHPSTMQSDIFD